MTQELQELLDKIRQEGVEKAQAEARTIIEAARQEAAATAAAAKEEAATIRRQAERDAAAFAQRAEQSVRQAARDVRLQVAQALDATFARLLRAEVERVTADRDALEKLVCDAVAAYLKGGEREIEVRLGGAAAEHAAALLARLRALAAGAEGLTVKADAAFPHGFTLRLAEGRVEHSFTAEAITEALARLLRPRLVELLRGDEQAGKRNAS